MADAVRGFSEDEFSTALVEALRYFKYDSLKVEQTECIRRVICLREDVLAVLLTGFGKSLIYQIIPKMLECLKNRSAMRTCVGFQPNTTLMSSLTVNVIYFVMLKR